MTENELSQAIEQRISQRFNSAQMRGGGAVQVSGADGSFVVSLEAPPPQATEEVVKDVPTGVLLGQVLLASHTGGQASYRFDRMGAVNNVRWTVNGITPGDTHPSIPLTGGKKLYAVITLTTASAPFAARGVPDFSARRFTQITLHTAEIRVVDRTVTLPLDNPNVTDPDFPGTYTIHAHLATYDGDGVEQPPYTDNPSPEFTAWFNAEARNGAFQIPAYGFTQFPPYLPEDFIPFNISPVQFEDF